MATNPDHVLARSAARCAVETLQVYEGSLEDRIPDAADLDLSEDVRIAFRMGMVTQSLIQEASLVLSQRRAVGDQSRQDLVSLLRSVASQQIRLALDVGDSLDATAFEVLREALR